MRMGSRYSQKRFLTTNHTMRKEIHHDRYGDLLGGHADRLPGFAVPQGAQDDESRLMNRTGRSALT